MSDLAAGLHVDPGLPATLVEQVRGQVTRLIADGTLQPDDELPGVRGLAATLGINFHTVRAAYQRLEADGLVESRHGRRTRVAHFDPRRLWPADSAARSHLVGFVVPSLESPFFGQLLEGAEEAARQSGTLLVICTTQDDQASALRAVAQIAARGADGVVVVSHDISSLVEREGADGADGDKPRWASRRFPLVVADRPGTRGHTVEFDLEAAGHLAARHLVEHGHRSLGLITLGVPASNVVPREAGFRRAAAEAGLEVDERHIARADGFDLASGRAAAGRLLAGADRPSGLVAISDLLAIGAMSELRRAGIRVPEDMAVVGIDDIALAEAVDPPLTTVALPARAMGAEAMATLELAWAGEAAAPRRIVLDVRLVVRGSCGLHAP